MSAEVACGLHKVHRGGGEGMSGWAEELAERIWRAERNLQMAQRNLRLGTDDARVEYARALKEMEQTHQLVALLCADRKELRPAYETAAGAMA